MIIRRAVMGLAAAVLVLLPAIPAGNGRAQAPIVIEGGMMPALSGPPRVAHPAALKVAERRFCLRVAAQLRDATPRPDLVKMFQRDLRPSLALLGRSYAEADGDTDTGKKIVAACKRLGWKKTW
ncbi:hypothetical protein [Streptomyces sp. N35]|uniref:hypothetical protein n=1 Tax=Streptomyces sp. N35 TaxID=2795730 RepID=UPI0018F4148C|nr:hypothetical protein [Streptomyces sp. N35]